MNCIAQLVGDINSFTNFMMEKDIINCIYCTLSKFSDPILKDFINSFEQIRYGPLEQIPQCIEFYNNVLANIPALIPLGYNDSVGYITFHKVLLICCLVRWNNPYVAITVHPESHRR